MLNNFVFLERVVNFVGFCVCWVILSFVVRGRREVKRLFGVVFCF